MRAVVDASTLDRIVAPVVLGLICVVGSTVAANAAIISAIVSPSLSAATYAYSQAKEANEPTIAQHGDQPSGNIGFDFDSRRFSASSGAATYGASASSTMAYSISFQRDGTGSLSGYASSSLYAAERGGHDGDYHRAESKNTGVVLISFHMYESMPFYINYDVEFAGDIDWAPAEVKFNGVKVAPGETRVFTTKSGFNGNDYLELWLPRDWDGNILTGWTKEPPTTRWGAMMMGVNWGLGSLPGTTAEKPIKLQPIQLASSVFEKAKRDPPPDDDEEPTDGSGSTPTPVTGTYRVAVPIRSLAGSSTHFQLPATEESGSSMSGSIGHVIASLGAPVISIDFGGGYGDAESIEVLFDGMRVVADARDPFDFSEYVPEGVQSFIVKHNGSVMPDELPFSIAFGAGDLVDLHVGVVTPATWGDYNADGIVDAADYTVWRDLLGSEGLAAYEGADSNGDGVVDVADFETWKASFGESWLPGGGGAGTGQAAVPEPGAAGLACGGAVAVLCSARRSRLGIHVVATGR